ncbi:MAG: hypothetical protein KAX78_07070 [Phycisphaerae bacterium]|nr:hypothetical protein [Phycisphaerae bacterium]
MQLQYKGDFDEALKRFEGWWDCQIIDRPLVSISVKSDGAVKLPAKSHPTIRQKWMDVQYNVELFEGSLDAAVFLGETFPKFSPNLGPDVCASLFGAELKFSARTSWSVPILESSRQILGRKPDLDNVYWQTIRDMTDLSLQRGAGRWVTGITDMHTNGDLLAALRGPMELCLDLADDIEAVRAGCEHVTDFFPTIYEDLWGRIEAAGMPATTFCPILHAGRSYMTSCDFICLISPEMLAKTILPSIVREAGYLERSMFHLDGPGALVHLDALLELDELDGVQWVYGAGNGPGGRWVDVYKKIQAAGKCMQLKCRDIDDAVALTEHLRPEGLWFTIGAEYSRHEAEAFLAWIGRWAAGKRG